MPSEIMPRYLEVVGWFSQSSFIIRIEYIVSYFYGVDSKVINRKTTIKNL